MAKKRHTAEPIITKLREAGVTLVKYQLSCRPSLKKGWMSNSLASSRLDSKVELTLMVGRHEHGAI
jgi:hypothetical protein